MEQVLTTDIFGVKVDKVLSYYKREQVDGKFVNSISQQKHIIMLG